MNEDLKNLLQIAINNENNKNILHENVDIIKEKKEKIIKELELLEKEKKEIKKKLKGYKFIEDLQEISIGKYYRWINISDINKIKLTNGGILVDILFEDETRLLFKNNLNKFMKINLIDNIIFQKLNNQELIILYAIENIEKFE